jgi:hypothetical protein
MGFETISADLGKIAVTIYENDNSIFFGTVKSFYFDTFTRFCSLDELLFAMGDLFNAIQYPMQTVKYRSFRSRPARTIKPKQVFTMEQLGTPFAGTEKATFVINVLYRQNATWQGNIRWVDRDQTLNFRSTNELIRLMESALSPDTEVIVDWDPAGTSEKATGGRE